MANPKERRQLLESDLAKSTNIEVDYMRELARLLLEDAKDALMSSTGDETMRLQGEARAFKRLADKLTRNTIPAAPSRPVMHAGVDANG